MVAFGLLVYRSILDGPPVGERRGVWLPALLFSVSGMRLAWGLARLLLGPGRSRALLAFAVNSVSRTTTVGPVSVVDGVFLFALCTSVLFGILLRLRSRAAQRRSQEAIAQATEPWRQQNKPPP